MTCGQEVAGSSLLAVSRVLPVGDAPHTEPPQAEVEMLETDEADRRTMKAVAVLMESLRADG